MGVPMRLLTPFAAIAGLALLTAMTAYYGFDQVAEAVASSKWSTLLVVLARAAALAGAGAGWWLLLTPLPPNLPVFVGLRFVRDAVNVLFPLTAVGGDVIGARLLAQTGISTSLAVASVLIDIFVQAVGLLVFVLTGVGIMLELVGAERLGTTAFAMLAIALPAIFGFFLTLNFGAFQPVTRWLVAFAEKRRWPAFQHVVNLGGRLQDLWRNHRGLLASFLVHLAAIFLGASEVWIVLWFMGHPVSIAQAVAIESLGQGSRAAVFVLPAGLGVQDGTLIAVCAIFGIPAEVALAMALIKRVPDLILGIPALAAWQAAEGRRLLSKDL